MDDTIDIAPQRAQATAQEAERLVVTTIAAHAPALLRTAGRHSLCYDDAQDAYQRALEIFLRHAPRLDSDHAKSWLHTVVKHEAMAVRKARQQLVASEEVDFDGFEDRHVSSPEDQVIAFEEIARSAEALQRLKPQEVHALWLQIQGLSYQEIADATGWTYTKVNRCLTEGRKAFLARYAGIQAGDECDRWRESLSLVADGEASAAQVALLRPHLRNCMGCRTELRALADVRPALQAVLPVPLIVVATGGGEAFTGLLTRVYQATVNLVQERAAMLAVKGQTIIDATAATKTTMVAASAIAIGGGVGVAERAAPPEPRPVPRAAMVTSPRPASRSAPTVTRSRANPTANSTSATTVLVARAFAPAPATRAMATPRAKRPLAVSSKAAARRSATDPASRRRPVSVSRPTSSQREFSAETAATPTAATTEPGTAVTRSAIETRPRLSAPTAPASSFAGEFAP